MTFRIASRTTQPADCRVVPMCDFPHPIRPRSSIYRRRRRRLCPSVLSHRPTHQPTSPLWLPDPTVVVRPSARPSVRPSALLKIAIYIVTYITVYIMYNIIYSLRSFGGCAVRVLGRSCLAGAYFIVEIDNVISPAEVQLTEIDLRAGL